jgi:E3 ubiquitin-protein ligase HERC2
MDRFGKAIYSWGCGRNGELGLGLPEDGTGTELIRFEPVRVPVPAGDSLPVFKDISAGGSQSAAVTITGELFTWGAGHMQATGHGTEGDENVWYMTQLDLQPVAGHDHEVMQVSTGEHHTLVLTRHQAAGN